MDSPVCDKEYLLKYGRLKSFEPYCYKFNNRRKEACRDFFGRMSIISGTLESDCRKRLSIHHTDHNKNQGCDGIPFNLVPMTTAENSKEKWNEQEYQDYINKTLREGFKWGIWNEQEYIEKVMYDE